MNTVWAWVRTNPTRVMAVATVVLGWLALAHVPSTVIGGVGTILGVILGGPVYNAVAPVARVVEAVHTAAATAADLAAHALDPATVGVAGEVTEAATATVAGVATDVAGEVLRGLGVNRRAKP